MVGKATEVFGGSAGQWRMLKGRLGVVFFLYSCFFRCIKSRAQSAHAYQVRILLQFKRWEQFELTWILRPSAAVKYFVSSMSDPSSFADGFGKTGFRKEMQQMTADCARTMATSTKNMKSEASGPTLKLCTCSLPNNAISVTIPRPEHARGSLSGKLESHKQRPCILSENATQEVR